LVEESGYLLYPKKEEQPMKIQNAKQDIPKLLFCFSETLFSNPAFCQKIHGLDE